MGGLNCTTSISIFDPRPGTGGFRVTTPLAWESESAENKALLITKRYKPERISFFIINRDSNCFLKKLRIFSFQVFQ
jgi:hypothetical protein